MVLMALEAPGIRRHDQAGEFKTKTLIIFDARHGCVGNAK
jgi:hypothetical protein